MTHSSPCFNCPGRIREIVDGVVVYDCHTDCSQYAAFKAGIDKDRKKKEQNLAKRRVYEEYSCGFSDRYKRRTKNNGK